jgi:glycosyltransferase involved in cell wall biosynthesis
MNLTIITSAPHIKNINQYFAYAPYVHEMNVWGCQVDEIVIVAPLSNKVRSAIDTNYVHGKITLKPVFNFDVTTVKSILKAIFYIPANMFKIFKAMRQADHIHLRCPGNTGLLGCVLQIFFPSKKKTAKYAGNWDPKVKQPWTYKLQKKILQNTFLTRNIQVLIYGAWEGQSENCKSFFTASYYEIEKQDLVVRNIESKINFIFVGALVKGKNPLYAIQLVEGLLNKGSNVGLNLYGEGVERNNLEAYITKNNLTEIISLKGNQDKATVKKGYQQSHFTLLPSKSEGWPKAIAEGMFWGCIPVGTAVSCVPFMLDEGKRGVLLEMNLEKDILQVEAILKDQFVFDNMQENAASWSGKYTLDLFEEEIKKLLQS